MEQLFGVFGVLGGLLCAIGDILFDLKGRANVKLGPAGMIDSNWFTMPEWRFRASILLAAAGVPLYLLGLIGMSALLSRGDATLGAIFFACAIVGACGGFFIHAILCCFAIMRKALTRNGVMDRVQFDMFERVYVAIRIPFVVMFCCLVVATSVVLIVAILRGSLRVPLPFVALNPLGLMLVGWAFRLIDRERFADLPGIIMPSVGLAMIGVMTVIGACA